LSDGRRQEDFGAYRRAKKEWIKEGGKTYSLLKSSMIGAEGLQKIFFMLSERVWTPGQ